VFVEEAEWIERELGRLPLEGVAECLNVGSSTLDYREREQSHLERQVLTPLRRRGLQVVNLDVKEAPGVDVVCDLTDPGFGAEQTVGRRFGLILCNNVLAHVTAVGSVLRALEDLVAPGGWLVVTTPGAYRLTEDPLDNGLRDTPEQLAARFPELDTVAAESVGIQDPRYYKGLVSRASRVPIRGRWITLPGASEQLRRLAPRLRWRETCLVLGHP